MTRGLLLCIVVITAALCSPIAAHAAYGGWGYLMPAGAESLVPFVSCLLAVAIVTRLIGWLNNVRR